MCSNDDSADLATRLGRVIDDLAAAASPVTGEDGADRDLTARLAMDRWGTPDDRVTAALRGILRFRASGPPR